MPSDREAPAFKPISALPELRGLIEYAPDVLKADISRIKMDQNASFTVDSYPEQSFKGKVVQIRNAPIITQNVVTYVTVVNVDNRDLRLKPGLNAEVRAGRRVTRTLGTGGPLISVSGVEGEIRVRDTP